MEKKEKVTIEKGTYLSAGARKALLNRLNRAEGQVRALKKMVEEGECADDLLVQVAAVKGAITKVAVKILENHLLDCANSCMASDGSVDEVYERITKALATVLKQS